MPPSRRARRLLHTAGVHLDGAGSALRIELTTGHGIRVEPRPLA